MLSLDKMNVIHDQLNKEGINLLPLWGKEEVYYGYVDRAEGLKP